MAGRKFQPEKTFQGLVKDRLRDGYTEQDGHTVIDNMAAAWAGNPKTHDWLRPSTLFGRPTKFAEYLGMVPQDRTLGKHGQQQLRLLREADQACQEGGLLHERC